MILLYFFFLIDVLSYATHYINHTGKIIMITNVSEHKRHKNSIKKKHHDEKNNEGPLDFIRLEQGQEGDLDNRQGDEITITSKNMSDKRRLFPSNNSFNYVITMNKYNARFEKFDINHAE